jgi:hypothetical protein
MGCGQKLAVSLAILASAAFAFANEGHAGEVAMERQEFVNLLANVQLQKERLANADQQIGLYKKLDADQKRLLVVHKDRIKELESYIASADKLIADFKTTMEQTELVLEESDKNLKFEKRLSRYKTEFIVGGVLVWLLW